MKIATWNVNSIRQREKHVQRWLERVQPDLLVLQEIKCEAANFPALTFHGIGYQSDVVGQKSYNGVAALGRVPFTVAHRSLPGLPDRRRPVPLHRGRGGRYHRDRHLPAERQLRR